MRATPPETTETMGLTMVPPGARLKVAQFGSATDLGQPERVHPAPRSGGHRQLEQSAAQDLRREIGGAGQGQQQGQGEEQAEPKPHDRRTPDQDGPEDHRSSPVGTGDPATGGDPQERPGGGGRVEQSDGRGPAGEAGSAQGREGRAWYPEHHGVEVDEQQAHQQALPTYIA